MQHDSELARAILQDFEQALAADADEAMPARGDRLPAVMDVDVVPMRELLRDGFGGNEVVAGDVVDGEVGKDHAPAERDAGRVALENFDLMRGVAQLHRDGEIEPRRPAADAGDLHENARGSCESCALDARAREARLRKFTKFTGLRVRACVRARGAGAGLD